MLSSLAENLANSQDPVDSHRTPALYVSGLKLLQGSRVEPQSDFPDSKVDGSGVI